MTVSLEQSGASTSAWLFARSVMVESEIAAILERARKQREAIERDMDDSATRINTSDLLERIDSLRRRIEESRRTFAETSSQPNIAEG